MLIVSEILTLENIMKKKIEPCEIIFNHVEKPKNFLMCKSTNVFDDKWRINIYSKRYVEGIEGKYISGSYFTRIDSESGELTIIS
jgi:hypothetical protein